MPPCGVWRETKVPADKVDEVIAAFNLEDPNPTIKTIDNHDGTFDVVATFPDCPDGSASNQPP
jgi:hypothetical protein